MPTVSFTLEGKDPARVAERLGLLEAGGMTRVGPVHYNIMEEIAKCGEALKQVAG